MVAIDNSEPSFLHARLHCRNINRNIDMSIKEYRLTSMEEPSDEILHELMEQVADSARKSTENALQVLHQKMQQTIEEIRIHKRAMSAQM